MIQWIFTCSVLLSKGLSLSQWIFTRNFSGMFQWMFTSVSSGVQYLAPTADGKYDSWIQNRSANLRHLTHKIPGGASPGDEIYASLVNNYDQFS